MYVILASASPRRRELLEQIGMDFDVQVSEADENIAPGMKPFEAVEELSYRKAKAVWDDLTKKEIVVGADTVVALDDQILGKPKNAVEAEKMLLQLQGREHCVYTGVTILTKDGERVTFHEGVKVFVTPMSREEICSYVATKDPMDKAGSYGIQGEFAKYVKGIQGDYNSVVGLPVGRLYQELRRIERAKAAKKVVIFDLDGTILDTIHSLTYCGNATLKAFGFGPFEEKDYQYFAGDGAANLVKRALRASGDMELSHFYEAFAKYKEIFGEHCMDGVKPFQDIPELIRELKKRGAKLAVLSNKPHAESIRVVESIFGKDVFDIIQGQMAGLALKPSADGVFQILQWLGEVGERILPENVLYLGDTGTDMLTGRSAGAFTVGALWGFRDREELMDAGADALVSKPLEVLTFI